MWGGGGAPRLVRCLGGLARWVDDRTAYSLVTSESGDPRTASVENCLIRIPQSPLLREPSTAVGQVLCESVIRLVHRLLVSPWLPSASAGPNGHPRLRLNQTTIIAVFVDSFVQVVAS